MSAGARMPSILLVEPQFVLRRTIVVLARDFGLGSLQEAASSEAAAPLLASKRFDGIVLDLGLGAVAVELLSRLRASQFASDAATPVIAMTAEPRHAVESRLAPFAVFSVLNKPFKVGELLTLMRQMQFSCAATAFAA